MKNNASPFREFFAEVSPIRMRDPLAGFLGAFAGADTLLEYSFADVVKMAGHACPTVGSAFVCCKKALAQLYPGEVPERGNIAVTIHAEADDQTYGVIGQVFGFVTGACTESGFKGLGHKFRRKDLLAYGAAGAGRDALQFTFARLDTGRKVTARLYPAKFPVVPGQAAMGELMEKAFWEAATPAEVRQFQDLWMERVKSIVKEERDVENWLVLESA